MNQPGESRVARVFRNQNTTLAAVIVVGVAILTLHSGGRFLTPISYSTFLTYLAVPVVVGLAQMVILAVGQLNLAVGAIGGMSACLAGVLMTAGMPEWLGVLVALATGLVAGVVNGLLVVTTGINGFIVTLATLTIFSGIQFALVGTSTLPPVWVGLQAIGGASFLGIPAIIVLVLVVVLAVWLLYRHFLFARNMLASGGNPLAARLSGISNRRSIVLAHGLSGLLCGVAALLALMSLPGVNQSVGGDWMLASFAAPIIGGVALTGGAVATFGTVLAAIIVRLIDSARAEFAFDPNTVNLVVGAVVLGTVALDRWRARRMIARRGEPDSPRVPVRT